MVDPPAGSVLLLRCHNRLAAQSAAGPSTVQLTFATLPMLGLGSTARPEPVIRKLKLAGFDQPQAANCGKKPVRLQTAWALCPIRQHLARKFRLSNFRSRNSEPMALGLLRWIRFTMGKTHPQNCGCGCCHPSSDGEHVLAETPESPHCLNSGNNWAFTRDRNGCVGAVDERD